MGVSQNVTSASTIYFDCDDEFVGITLKISKPPPAQNKYFRVKMRRNETLGEIKAKLGKKYRIKVFFFGRQQSLQDNN